MAVAVQSGIDKIADYLGNDADDLLDYEALVNQNLLTLPACIFLIYFSKYAKKRLYLLVLSCNLAFVIPVPI